MQNYSQGFSLLFCLIAKLETKIRMAINFKDKLISQVGISALNSV